MKWGKEMYEEMESLNYNHTWELIKKIVAAKLVSYKWIFKLKEGIPGVEGYEAKGKKDHICKLNKFVYELKQSPR